MFKKNLNPSIVYHLESLVASHEKFENLKSEKRLIRYGDNAGKLGQVVIVFLFSLIIFIVHSLVVLFFNNTYIFCRAEKI